MCKQTIKILLALILHSTFILHSSGQTILKGNAPVYPPTGGFQIDGDLTANTPAGTGDWVPGPSGTGGYVLNANVTVINNGTTFHLIDKYANSTDDGFAGGLKFDQNPNLWSWVLGPIGNKVDINHGLFHFTRSSNGHQWVVVGADR